MKKNGYAARDLKVALKMAVKQAEFKSGKPVELLLTKAESNEDTIKNITVLLAGSSPQKLKRIYEIISMMLKL